METKLYVKKPVILLLTLAFFAGAVLIIFFTLKNRYELADRSEEYTHIVGEVAEVGENKHESSDDDDDYSTYTVTVRYMVDGTGYFCSSDDDYRDYVYVGDKMDVMYRTDSPGDSYIAGKDFFTGKYLPYKSTSALVIVFAGFLFSFSMIFFAALIKKSRAQVLLIGFAFLLMGAVGIFDGIVDGNLEMFVMIIFGAIGLLILFGNGFKSKQKRKEIENTDLRLFTVIDVLDNELGGITAILNEGAGTLDGTVFSYNTFNRQKFYYGAKFQVNMNKIDISRGANTYNGRSAVDISYLPEDAFRELSKMVKKIINLAENNMQ